MALPTSGVITMDQICTEFKIPLTSDLGCDVLRKAAKKPAPQDISMSDFYGKSNTICYLGTLTNDSPDANSPSFFINFDVGSVTYTIMSKVVRTSRYYEMNGLDVTGVITLSDYSNIKIQLSLSNEMKNAFSISFKTDVPFDMFGVEIEKIKLDDSASPFQTDLLKWIINANKTGNKTIYVTIDLLK